MDNQFSKYIALKALAFGWHDDSNTLKFLQDASKDTNETIRETAILLIGQGWWNGNPGALSTLQNCALIDKSPSARNSAIQIISEGGSNNPSVLFFYCNMAKSASDFNTRLFAIKHIGKIWKKDIVALALLKDRAINDTYSGVREMAVSFLGNQWKDDPSILIMLRERVAKEPNPAIREIICKILATKDAKNCISDIF